MLPSCRWTLASPPPRALADALPDVHPAVVAALASRGFGDPTAARAFLERSPGDDDPFRLAGMTEAVDRIRRAVRAGEPIVVYGDYDADGVTATAVLVETLGTLGARVSSFLPHRARDGYGLHAAVLDRLAEGGARLIVTVDCGIRAGAEIAHAARLGIDVVVTDHHALSDAIPDAVAVINPRRGDCPYGFKELSGVGLAYKLAQGLLRVARRTDRAAARLDEADLLDLVALGTVADVVPLVGENRSLVDRGLVRLRAAGRPGIRAMLASAGRAAEALTARDLAFVLGPRVNAAGRMDDADLALAVLLARDPVEAGRLAERLEDRNRERRAATETVLAHADTALAGRTDGPFLSYATDDVALGVAGLVAGRLTNRHYRPSAVVRLEGDLARGSARSIPEFNIIAALDEAAALLVRFGGHARAAGFTVRTSDLDALLEQLAGRSAAALAGRDLRPVLGIDAGVTGADLTWAAHAALAALEPFGEGNPRPLLLWRDAVVASPRVVGGRHLRFVVEGGPGVGSLDAIAFDAAERLPELGRRADVVFSVEDNTWQGRRRLELHVADMADPGLGLEPPPQSRMTTGVPSSAQL